MGSGSNGALGSCRAGRNTENSQRNTSPYSNTWCQARWNRSYLLQLKLPYFNWGAARPSMKSPDFVTHTLDLPTFDTKQH